METKREKVVCSEENTSEAATSEAAATRGKGLSYNTYDSITDLDSTSSSSSTDSDNIPLNRVYKTSHKVATPSPSSKTTKKPDDVETSELKLIDDRLGDLVDQRLGLCKNFPADHWFILEFAKPLQMIPADEHFEGEQSQPSQPKPTTQTSDSSILEELANHYNGELPGFQPTLEKASETILDTSVSESLQQYQPNSQMVINTCFELIIHLDYKPYHLSATHSNISFGIALRNLANKWSSSHKPYISDNNLSLSDKQTFVVRAVSVALPSVSLNSTLDPQPSHEHSTEPDYMFTSDSNVEDEHVVQTNLSLNSSSLFVLEFVHDTPFIASNQSAAIEISSTYIPSSSHQIIPQMTTTHVSPPPTLLLDFVILKEVCENIFDDLNKLVKSRNNFVHAENYEEKWTALRERVDTVMCELLKLSLKAHHQSINTLNNWFKEVVNNMKEVEVNKDQEKHKLYLSYSPFYLDVSSIITATVQQDLSLN